MSELSAKNELPDGLAMARRFLAFSQFIIQCAGVAQIPDRHHRHWRVCVRNLADLARRIRVEACHLVQVETQGRRFEAEIANGEPHIVPGSPIRPTTVSEVQLHDGERQHRRSLCPSIPWVQTTRQLLEGICIRVSRDHEAPWLFIRARRCPSGGFEQAEEFFELHWTTGESSRTPAVKDQ